MRRLDVDIEPYRGGGARDPLFYPLGPITRARAKEFKQAVGMMVQDIWNKDNLDSKLEDSETPWRNMITFDPANSKGA